MDPKIMVYSKNGAMAPYNEAIYAKGGWELASSAPVGFPVADEKPTVSARIEAPAPAEKKPGRPAKASGKNAE